MVLDTEHVGAWKRLDGTPIDEPDSPPDLTFAHVSDLHGQLSPIHQIYYNNPHSCADLAFEGENRLIKRGGGLPVLTAKLDELRAEYDDRVLTVMSGDTFHGSAISTYSNGYALLEPVNEHLDPDVYVPGNWDFSNEAPEDGNFLELMNSLDAPVLATNLYDWDTDDRLFDPFQLFDVGDVTVGVVGMTNPYIDRMAPAFWDGKYRFGKHPWLLEEAAREARSAGSDIVVAVTEIGLQWMVQAAKDCPSIDVMFSAHTHEYTYDPIYVESTATLVVESGMSEALGRLDVRFVDGDLRYRHQLYCLVEGQDYTPEPDPAAQRTVEAIREPFVAEDVHFERGNTTLDQPLTTVVGETDEPLFRQAFLESPWNTLLNDALRDRLDADLAISHGFRYGTAIPAGEITLGDVYTFFPTTAPVATGEAFGQQIANHMEDFLADNFSPDVYEQEDGRLRNYSSNVDVTIDPTAKRGRRLVELRIDGERIDPEASYTVAAVRRPGDGDRSLGGCGFPFRDVEVATETTLTDVIVDFIETHSPVEYEETGLVSTPTNGGAVQNTPADGPYPYIQPGVDYANGEAYCETRMIPGENTFPERGRNRFR